MKKTKKGFTLVELLVVIAILAILATVSIVGYTGFIKKANESNVLTEAKQVYDICYAYDIQDGVIGDDVLTETNFEGSTQEKLPHTTGVKISYKTGVFTYTYNGLKATFSGGEWTVTASGN